MQVSPTLYGLSVLYGSGFYGFPEQEGAEELACPSQWQLESTAGRKLNLTSFFFFLKDRPCSPGWPWASTFWVLA